MQKWEYLLAVRFFDAEKGKPFVSAEGREYEDEPTMLSALGANGWELTGVANDVGSNWNFAAKAYQISTVTLLFFKRPCIEQ